MDELLVVLHNRADHSKRSLSISFTLSDTVRSIEERISAKTGTPRQLLKASENRVGDQSSHTLRTHGAFYVDPFAMGIKELEGEQPRWSAF